VSNASQTSDEAAKTATPGEAKPAPKQDERDRKVDPEKAEQK